MTLYVDYQPALYPTALSDPYGRAWGASQGTMKDRVVTLAVDAVDAGLVLRAPADALPLLGADVALDQLPDETTDSYRTRIAGAWETWRWAGTETALRLVATQLGADPVVIVTAHTWPMGRPDLWARWWLLVRDVDLPHTPAPEDPWGTGTWGDGGTWGSTVPPEGVAQVQRAFRKFTNARDAGWVRIAFGDTDYWGDPDGTFAHGTWGDSAPFVEWRI
ncbi:MAG: hypothetical protein JWM10_1934 [Myxococcaceae bacterium]|nr:hypothetical protein [Myxococcaceae bacterium]